MAPEVGELEADVARTRAAFEAMRGDIAKAREQYSEGKAVMDELGRPVMSAFAVQEGWYIEMLARDFRGPRTSHDPSTAGSWRRDSLALQDITRDMLALSLCAQGRFEEADVLARETERKLFGVGYVVAENVWRRVRARSFSARGDHREAVRLAREAEAKRVRGYRRLGRPRRMPARPRRGPPCRRRPRRGAEAARRALALSEQKENVVEAGRAKDFLAELRR